MTEPEWRTVEFHYRIPEGAIWDELETRMIEAMAEMIGCNHDGMVRDENGDVDCPADWAASCGPMKDDEGEKVTDE